MIYQSADKTLKCVLDVFHGTVNDVYICEDIRAKMPVFYMLWVIHSHDTAKKLLEIYEAYGEKGRKSYVESFSSQDDFCVVLEYREERKLDEFYMGAAFSLHESEMVCMNLIVECIGTSLPYPLLYLVLAQNQIHILKDKNVYFSYGLDLEMLDSRKRESDCAIQCARILLKLLKPKKKAKAISYRILELKAPKQCYTSFTELYKDVGLAAVPTQKRKLKMRIQAFFRRNQDLIFRIFLVLCIVFGSAALIMLLSQMIWGDVPFYRLFINPFKTIGTESLLQ